MDDEDTVNLEAQASPDPDYLKRVVTYTSWRHGGQIDRGKKYSEATRTISVNILGYEQFKDRESYKSSFMLRDEESGDILNHDLLLLFFELPKFMRYVQVPRTKQERWLAYLAGVGGKLMEQIAEQEPRISDALAAERFFMMDWEKRLAYIQEWKHVIDETTREARAEARGEAKGRREGELKAKYEIAKKFISRGIAPDVVAESSGLSLEEVRNLM
jgi:predicted transposase/invertase (TIGR01784 family)